MATIKKCIDCNNEFQATSNVQKRCVECGAKHKAEKNKTAYKAKPSQASHTSKPRRVNGHECEGCREFAQVEKIMIAAGIITAEKFEQARKFVKGLEN